ncbi:DUF6932 family protein [Candidatus Entotheonella palauensis]|nr:hypothetical protein [Candidatus Entotheonella palauensis]
MSLPETLASGFLPPGVHVAKLDAIIEHFGVATPRRVVLAGRLRELLHLAQATEYLQRAFVFGSFVTDVPFPRDLDVFLLMQAGFDRVFQSLPPDQRKVFEHEQAQLVFEADIFWATEAIGADELTAWLSVYQLSRELVPRGIVEVERDD